MFTKAINEHTEHTCRLITTAEKYCFNFEKDIHKQVGLSCEDCHGGNPNEEDMDLAKIGIETNFSGLDWCIVVGYILVIVGIGIYIKRYISNVTDFIVAGRGLKTFLAIATMIGTELGLVTVIYNAQKGFTGGFAAFHIALAAAIMTLVVGLTGFIVVPLRRMRVMTIRGFHLV